MIDLLLGFIFEFIVEFIFDMVWRGLRFIFEMAWRGLRRVVRSIFDLIFDVARGLWRAVGRSRQPPHVTQAVERGGVGRQSGWWYRVDVTPDGRTTWTPVDPPGDGSRMTVQQSPAPRRHPVELTEPLPGTQVL